MQISITEETLDYYPNFSYLHNIFRVISKRNLIASGPIKFLQKCLELAGLPTDTNIRLHQIDSSNPVSSLSFVIYPQDNGKIFLRNKERVLSLQLPEMCEKLDSMEHHSYLGVILPLYQSMVIHALGNLLNYLDAHWKYIYVVEQSIVTVTNLKVYHMNDMLLIDNSTLLALNIFSPKENSSTGFNFGNTTNDPLSLYMLLNKCCSKYASIKLKIMLSRPIRNVNEIRYRHSIIEWCLQKENVDQLMAIKVHLKSVCNINRVYVKLLMKPIKKPKYLKAIRDTIREMKAICDICVWIVAGGEKNILFKQLTNKGESILKEMLHIIDEVIDVDKSVLENQFVIRPEFDPILAQSIESFDTSKLIILQSIEIQTQEYPDKIIGLGLIYRDTIGFVLSRYTVLIFL